jgi:hypothetical protein
VRARTISGYTSCGHYLADYLPLVCLFRIDPRAGITVSSRSRRSPKGIAADLALYCQVVYTTQMLLPFTTPTLHAKRTLEKAIYDVLEGRV